MRTTEKYVASRFGRRDIAGDWRDCIRTRMFGGIMLAANAPGGAAKALID